MPTRYASLPMQESPLDDDPVFSDTAVKPGSSMEGLVANKSTYVVPEKTQHSAPPHYTAVKADVLLPLPNATTKPIRFNIIANSSMVITIKDARKVVDEFPSTAFLGFGAIGFTSLIKATMELFYLCLAMGVVHTIKFGTRFWFGLAMVYCSFVLADFQFAVADMFFTTAGGNGTTTMESIDVHSNWAKVPIWSFPIWICLLYSSFVLAVLGWSLILSSLAGVWFVGHCEMAVLAENVRQLKQHEHTSPGSKPLSLPTKEELEEMMGRICLNRIRWKVGVMFLMFLMFFGFLYAIS